MLDVLVKTTLARFAKAIHIVATEIFLGVSLEVFLRHPRRRDWLSVLNLLHLGLERGRETERNGLVLVVDVADRVKHREQFLRHLLVWVHQRDGTHLGQLGGR